MKIGIILVGRQKQKDFREYEQDLRKRLTPFAKITDIETEDEDDVFKHCPASGATYVLDVGGAMVSSEQFSGLLDAGSITFVIGPAQGFSVDTLSRLKRTAKLLSLSPMTLPHRLCKVVLLEQIYRGFCIKRGLPYAK